MLRHLFNFGFAILSSILGGFILAKMWGWFIVPQFHVPVLTMVGAMGLSMTVNFSLFALHTEPMMRRAREESKNKEIDDVTWNISKNLVMLVLVMPMMLGMAYVLSLFMPK